MVSLKVGMVKQFLGHFVCTNSWIYPMLIYCYLPECMCICYSLGYNSISGEGARAVEVLYQSADFIVSYSAVINNIVRAYTKRLQ